jgi:hypothetical protein
VAGYRSSPTLCTAAARGHDRHLCRQVESKMDLTVGCRGYGSSTRVGSVAPLGNTKEDDYYRNDSMKYCRHEEKKRKRRRKVGCEARFKYSSWMVRALLRTRQICRAGGSRLWIPTLASGALRWKPAQKLLSANQQRSSREWIHFHRVIVIMMLWSDSDLGMCKP